MNKTKHIRQADTAEEHPGKRMIRDLLSLGPYQTVDDMAGITGMGHTSVREWLDQMVEDGQLGHVSHALLGRNSSERYCLVREGVCVLEGTSRKPERSLMARRGATNKGLSELRKRIDVLACVYRLVAAIASCYPRGAVDLTVYTGGPLDAAVELPGPPGGVKNSLWVGIMVRRPGLYQKSFELRLWEYRDPKVAAEERPSQPAALLVLSPDAMSNRRVARLVERNFHGLAWVAPVTDLESAEQRIWRQRTVYDRETWSLYEVLAVLTGNYGQAPHAPVVEPYERAALALVAPPSAPTLTRADKRVLFALADWPLEDAAGVAIFARVGEAQVLTSMTTLRRHALARTVETRPVPRFALTDGGLKMLSAAAREKYSQVRKRWSSAKNADDLFVGTRLRKLWKEKSHTLRGYDVARRFAKVASVLAYVSDYAVLPEHQSRQSFRVQGFRYPFRILPDVTVLLHNREVVDDGQTGRTTRERREAILVEVEQGDPTFEDMKSRLSSYARYYETERPHADYGTLPYIAVVLKHANMEGRFLAAQRAAQLTGLPIITTTPDRLGQDPLGPFGVVWRTPRHLDAVIPYWSWHEVEEE